ncbi:MAG: hypothetical protein LBM66_04720, partial [Bifidobacteriaceae bacterium]|nr:hypothetical protein [Bifidobacteriaceae bacterium]
VSGQTTSEQEVKDVADGLTAVAGQSVSQNQAVTELAMSYVYVEAWKNTCAKPPTGYEKACQLSAAGKPTDQQLVSIYNLEAKQTNAKQISNISELSTGMRKAMCMEYIYSEVMGDYQAAEAGQSQGSLVNAFSTAYDKAMKNIKITLNPRYKPLTTSSADADEASPAADEGTFPWLTPASESDLAKLGIKVANADAEAGD